MVIAILREGIYNHLNAINKLFNQMGFKEELTYDEIISLLKLKSYELFEDNLNENENTM